MIFTGTDFATLGVTEGSYVWSWGSGGSADSLTLNIVPEPASVALLVLAGLGITVAVETRITLHAYQKHREPP
ncbi:MAG: PEP-CTERM sorting domain-containing protein [Phycisphaerales bacterium]